MGIVGVAAELKTKIPGSAVNRKSKPQLQELPAQAASRTLEDSPTHVPSWFTRHLKSKLSGGQRSYILSSL